MKPDLKELKLGRRGNALAIARRMSQTLRAEGGALDEAFAHFTAPPRRTDVSHAGTGDAAWDSGAIAQQITAQIDQLEQQRKRLSELLESLDGAE